MLMDLVVSTGCVGGRQLLIPAFSPLKQPQVPVRIVCVAQPLSHEHEPAIYPVAISGRLSVRKDRPEFRLGALRKNLVGIKDQYPFVPKSKIVQCPVLLLWPSARKLELHNLATESFGDG